MSLYLIPKPGRQLLQWSYTHELPPKRPDNTYFVNIASMDASNQFSICLQFNSTTLECPSGPTVAIAAATHELVDYSKILLEFLSTLPKWVTTIDVVASYQFIEA